MFLIISIRAWETTIKGWAIYFSRFRLILWNKGCDKAESGCQVIYVALRVFTKAFQKIATNATNVPLNERTRSTQAAGRNSSAVKRNQLSTGNLSQELARTCAKQNIKHKPRDPHVASFTWLLQVLDPATNAQIKSLGSIIFAVGASHPVLADPLSPQFGRKNFSITLHSLSCSQCSDTPSDNCTHNFACLQRKIPFSLNAVFHHVSYLYHTVFLPSSSHQSCIFSSVIYFHYAG